MPTKAVLLEVELVRHVANPFLPLNYSDPNPENTAEQRTAIIAAASNSQSLSVVQSEPVIGKRRLNYGGKSVAGLQKLWKKGLPEHL